MTGRKWFLAAGFIVSAVFLAAILWRLDWPAFLAELGRVRYSWLVVTLVIFVLGIAMRAMRWNVAAGMPFEFLPAFWSSAVIGLMLNQIYPLRAGEVVRIFALRKMAPVSLGQAATSSLIDRLADVLFIGICAVVVVTTHTGLPLAEKFAAGTLILAVAALIAVIVFGKCDRIWRGWSSRWGKRIPAKLTASIHRFYAGAVETSRQVASPARLVGILLLTSLAFACDLAFYFTVIRSFGWELPAIAPMTVLVFLAIGTALPAAPGYAGVYQIACVLALALFGIAEPSALAYSVVLQICVLTTVACLAALVVMRHRDALKAVQGELADGR